MLRFIVLFLLMLPFGSSFAPKAVPDFEIETIEQKTVSIKELLDENKPLVISFWTTYCKPCISELTEIADVYEDWKEEVDFNFLAISIDDSRSLAKVKSVVFGKDWPFVIGLDPNQIAKRKLNVTNIPQTFIFNPKGELIYQHQGYTPGSELEILEKIRTMK
ncbi:MAG: TlpA family protein disulfide reductase [Mangrovibacterium sp.]